MKSGITAAAVLACSLMAAAQNMDAEGPPVALLPSSGQAQTGDKLMPNAAQTPVISVTAELNPQAGANAPMLTNTGAQTAAAPPWSGYAAAESMAAGGNPELALKQLNSRLSQAPDDAKAAYLKGLVLMQLSRGEEAERWFKMMQSNFPELPQPYNALAVIYTGKGDLLSAENTLQALLAQHPDNRTAQINLANIYVKLARENYGRALKAKPDDAMIADKLKALESIDK